MSYAQWRTAVDEEALRRAEAEAKLRALLPFLGDHIFVQACTLPP